MPRASPCRGTLDVRPEIVTYRRLIEILGDRPRRLARELRTRAGAASARLRPSRSAQDRLRGLARGPLRPAERWCLAGAVACFAWVGWVWLDGALWQERQIARLEASAEAPSVPNPAASSELPPVELSADGPRWERAVSAATAGAAAGDDAPSPSAEPASTSAVDRGPAILPGETAPPPSEPGPAPAAPAALAELSVPRLGLSWAVAEGVAARTLRRAPGWIPGTARPGSPGNVGVAGHRDRHFRRLEEVAVGDELVLGTPAGPRRYRVDWIRVVSPSETGVLAQTDADALTLVTCYPFRWIGTAPDRYVVRAVAVD